MIQPLYVHAIAAISPQNSFGAAAGLEQLTDSSKGRLFVQDADYRAYINPVAIRRMSRALKMSIAAAMDCLQQAGWSAPEAIITGTGRGSMGDMEQFLKDMIRLEETALNPTYFIQSTYNSPNGWIALQTKSNGYNQTYVHRGLSLELALLDAQLLAAENQSPQRLLVGSYDELSEEYFFIKSKIGYWKSPAPPSSLDLLKAPASPGTIAGEGAAFLALSAERTGAKFVLHDIRVIQDANAETVDESLTALLIANGLVPQEVDAVLAGLNGDSRQDPVYGRALQQLGECCLLSFKNLCGEYDTSTGFALWLAAQLLEGNPVPEAIKIKGDCRSPLRTIVLINHYIAGSASLMLLSAL